MNATVNTARIKEDHYLSGLSPDMDCADHSPLLHRIGEIDSTKVPVVGGTCPACGGIPGGNHWVDCSLEELTSLDRIVALEARAQRLKKTLNEVIAFANGLETRIEALEGKKP